VRTTATAFIDLASANARQHSRTNVPLTLMARKASELAHEHQNSGGLSIKNWEPLGA
jgi:hypothetical protein